LRSRRRYGGNGAFALLSHVATNPQAQQRHTLSTIIGSNGGKDGCCAIVGCAIVAVVFSQPKIWLWGSNAFYPVDTLFILLLKSSLEPDWQISDVMHNQLYDYRVYLNATGHGASCIVLYYCNIYMLQRVLSTVY
jgi:hypothetical protein